MNGTLYVLAAIAPPVADAAAPATPWAPLMGVLPVLAGAVIGYVFGFLRDQGQAKIDRQARHRDEVLAASSQILAAATIIRDADKAGERILATIVDQPEKIQTHGSRLWDQATVENERIQEARLGAHLAVMKMRVITPELYPLVQAVMAPPWRTERLEGPLREGLDGTTYLSERIGNPEDAMDALADGVTRYLKGTLKASQHRAWISARLLFKRRAL